MVQVTAVNVQETY